MYIVPLFCRYIVNVSRCPCCMQTSPQLVDIDPTKKPQKGIFVEWIIFLFHTFWYTFLGYFFGKTCVEFFYTFLGHFLGLFCDTFFCDLSESYLISKKPRLFKNIAYFGSLNYFLFVYHQHFAAVQSLARSLCFVLQPPHPTQFSSPPSTKVNFSHCHRHHCYRHCCRRNNHPRRTFDIQPFGTGEHCGVFKNWHFLNQKQNLFKSTIQKYI